VVRTLWQNTRVSRLRRLRSRALIASLLCAIAHAEVAAAQNRPALQLQGYLNTTKVDTGHDVPFVMTATNLSTEAVLNLRVPYVGGSHVSLYRAWWCSNPQDVKGWESLQACPVARTLAPGQSTTIFGTIRTFERGTTSVIAAVEWESPYLSRATVQLGTLEVEDWWVRWIAALAAVLPGLALPIVVAILGAWFQWRLKETEHSRQEHAQKLADQRNDREYLRSEQAEALRLMLPISHDYDVKYYADLDSAAGETVEAISIVRSLGPGRVPTSALDSAFYEWLFLFVRIRFLNANGAFYFKNQTGELLVGALFKAFSLTFVDQCPPHGGPPTLPAGEAQRARRLLGQAVDSTEPRASLDSVLTRLELERTLGTGTLLALANWFHVRVMQSDVAESMQYLRAFRAVLTFETYRPYVHWYGRQVRLRLDDDLLLAVVRLCERLRADEELCGVADELDEYLIEAGIPGEAVHRARNAQGTTPSARNHISAPTA